ncbi:cupin domain-containing protein [uncultured Ruegeria sp.]|uniref:cupin domain-containing protein n=1 Tax=uncultured Ruegeria sp. TaxID=259304 RepID=UPI002630FAB0|nr:cupin domain-containing protein [uncultured Ruegeria sp.]
MFKYQPGDDVGELELWSFDNPESDYRITKGAPKTYGRIDLGGVGHTTRFGIWRCTAGAVECTEQGDELMTILSGHCRITRHDDGESRELSPGDTLFVRDGTRVTWDVHEEVTKVFFGHKAEEY